MTEAAWRSSARGLILDDRGRYVLLRRARPGGRSYLVVPGGGVADGESFQEAVRRECAEELGARVTVGRIVLVDDHDEPAPGGVQRLLLCRLESIDDRGRTGHEFHEPWRGTYETVRLAATDPALAGLRPAAIGDLIGREHALFLREAAELR